MIEVLRWIIALVLWILFVYELIKESRET